MRFHRALIVPIFLAAPFLAGADATPSTETVAQPPAKLAAKASHGRSDLGRCVDRGVQYFKNIGSYPTLTTEPNVGRDAESVAIERCRRSFRAF